MDLLDFSPRRRLALWAAVVSGLLLAMLDQTIVGTALPEIVEDLGSPTWYVWAFTCYLVPATVLLPVAARLSDRLGRQRVLVGGMGLFVLGSIACAAAVAMPMFAAGRAVQGAGAAALEALSFLVVNELARTGRQGAGQAAISAVMGFSFVAGPVVGGVLTDHVGWRWAFLVNVPIGFVAMAMLVAVLPPSFGRSESRGTPIDLAGIAALTVGVGGVLVGINQHQQLGTWAALSTGGAVALGVLACVAFIVVERRAVAPVIPLRLLVDRTTGRLLLAAAFATTGIYVGVMLIPRWYQADQGLSATASGVRVYPLLIGLLLAVNVGAVAVVRRNDVRGPLLVAAALVLGGCVLFGRVGASSPGWLPLAAMAVLGFGMGPALSGLQIGIARTTAPGDLAAAMGTLLLGRQVIGCIALAVGDVLYRSRLDASGAAAATGWAVALVAGGGAVVAAAALVGLRRGLPGQQQPGTQPARQAPELPVA